MKRPLISLIAGAAFLAAPISAMADDETAPLPPGGAAGVEQAQFANTDVPVLWWLGGGVVLGALILALSSQDSGTPIPATQPTNSVGTGTN